MPATALCHLRWLRLRQGIPRRAAVARGTVAPQRAAIAGDGLELRLSPSPEAAPRLLTWDEDHSGAGGFFLRPDVLDLTQRPPCGLQMQPTASDHIE